MSFFNWIGEKEIDNEIAYLKNVLKKKPTRRNYQLTHELLKISRGFAISKTNLQSELQKAADAMCKHLLIKKPIKIITINSVGAGKFETLNGLNCIYVNNDLELQNYKQKIAILAHEMAHYYLMIEHRIIKPNVTHNEFLTEVAAVYLGLGYLCTMVIKSLNMI